LEQTLEDGWRTMEDMSFDVKDFKAASKLKTLGILGRKENLPAQGRRCLFFFRKRHSWIMTCNNAYKPFLRGYSFLFVLFLSCLDATDYMTSSLGIAKQGSRVAA